MIRVKHSPGSEFYNTNENIRSVTVWMSAIETKGGMRFYEGDVANVVDASLGEVSDETVIIVYPWTDKKFVLEAAEKQEKKIRELLTLAGSKSQRKVFSMSMSSPIRILTRDDFSGFTPNANPEDELFIFDNPDPSKGFPSLFVLERGHAVSYYGQSFKILARMSRTVFPCVDAPTTDGARFTYMLFNSYVNVTFVPDCPNTTGMRFPTKLTCELPSDLNTEAFEKFLIKHNVDKIKVLNGKVVKVADDEEEYQGVGQNPTIKEVEAGLEEYVKKQIQEQESVSFLNAVNLGLERVLELVPISNKIINIVLDIQGVVQRMCIHQGIYHILPLFDEDNNLADMLDVGEEWIRICSAETYPKKSTA